MFAITIVLMLTLTASLLCNFLIFSASAQISPTISVGNGTGYVNSTSVVLTVSAVNATQMQFSNDGSTWSSWEAYTTTKNWALTDGDGVKTVYAQLQDSSNAISTASAQVALDTVPPIPYPYYEWVSITNRTLSFDGSGSIDDSPIRFLWNFGDSNTATGVTATHTYATLGNYTAYVTVTDIAGNSAKQLFIVYVLDPSAFATNTPTPAPTQNPVPTPTSTPIASTSTQPSSGSGETFSAVELILLVGVVFLVIIVVVLVFLIKRNRWTKPKPN
jgi:hypothetical protein